MSAFTSRRLLGLILVATLAAAYFAPETEQEPLKLTERVSTAAARTPDPVARSGTPRTVEVLAIRPRGEAGSADAQGLFSSHQWKSLQEVKLTKVVNAVAVEPPPPAPQAPSLPFKALGRYTDEAGERVFLQYNDQNLVVRVGDTVAQQYKVESLDGNTLTLRYMPLNQTQTMNVGAAN